MEANEKACSFCGQAINARSIVCLHCGRDKEGRQRRPGVSDAAAVPAQPKRFLEQPAVIYTACAAALAVFLWGQFKGDKPRPQPVQAERISQPASTRQQNEAPAQQGIAEMQRLTNMHALRPMDGVMSKWFDAASLATSAPRVSLAGPVATLQGIRREARAVIVPECMELGKAMALQSMDKTIEALLIFIANSGGTGNAEANLKLGEATSFLQSYEKARRACLA
jgi:hypothetical protein